MAVWLTGVALLHFFFLALVVFLALFAIAALWGAHAISRQLAQRRRLQVERLRDFHVRLTRVVAAMLARADEIDQEGSYRQLPVPVQHSQRLGNACKQLVVLSESLSRVEFEDQGTNLTLAREQLLASCRVASHLCRELRDLRRHLSVELEGEA